MKTAVTSSGSTLLGAPPVGSCWCHNFDPDHVYLRIDTEQGIKALEHSGKDKDLFYSVCLTKGEIACTNPKDSSIRHLVPSNGQLEFIIS